MRVVVQLVVDVELDEWASTSGNWKTYPTAAEVRADVKAYLLNLAQQASMLDEAGAEVSLR